MVSIKKPVLEEPKSTALSVPFIVLLIVNIILVIILVYEMVLIKSRSIPPHIVEGSKYIKEHLAKGHKIHHLRNHMKKSGWKDEDIVKAYKHAK